jgi:hypothetical protein
MIRKHYKQSDNTKQVINYDNAALYYSGRWNFDTVGMCSGWQGSQIRFRFKSTNTIKLNVFLDITTTTDLSICTFHIDNYNQFASAYNIHTAGTIFNGNKSIEIPVINDGNWHTIYLYIGGVTNFMFNKAARTILKSLEIDGGAEISLPSYGNKLIQFVGDSWNGAFHDYPFLLNQSTYNYYQVSGGGLKCSDADTMYLYDYNGILNTTDITPNAIVVSFGVNDYNASVSVGAFQTSLLSLIDKIQTKQPGVKIFLVRIPNNTGASKTYGQYLTSMNNVAGLRSNVIVGDTTTLDSQVDWIDAGHLGGNGKVLLKDFLETTLTANGI